MVSGSSSGVCAAIAALPDRSASERAFSNLAHDALHGLAAEPGLSRALSARLLEAMERVEADFRRATDVAALSTDLGELQASTDAALQALDRQVPACVR
jgi:hypothetical protein